MICFRAASQLGTKRKEGNEDIVLLKRTEQLKKNESAFNLQTGMTALEVQQKVIVEINILFLI